MGFFSKKKYSKNNQGVVLVMTLIIMTLIMISVLAFSAIITGEVKMTINTGNVVISYYAAESGIEKGLHRIKYSRENSDFSYFKDLDNTGANEFTINNSYIKSRKYEIEEAITDVDDYMVYNLSTSSPAHVDIIDPTGAVATIDWDAGFGVYQYKVDWMINDCFPYHASDKLEISVTSFSGNFLNPSTKKEVAICDCSFNDNDCDSDAACVTDGTEGHLGECVVCIESDDGSDYETAGTISQGVWKTNGEYYSGGSDSCQSSTHLKELRCSVDGSSGKAFAFYTARSCSDAVGENSVCLEDEEGRGYCSPGSEDTMVRNENLDRAPEQKEKGFFGRVLDKLRP